METIPEENDKDTLNMPPKIDNINNINNISNTNNVVDFDETHLDMLNTFMQYYHSKTGNKIHMFKDVNYSDPTSINNIMAEFYDIICSYNDNSKNNPERNKVYKENHFREKITFDQLFCLKCNKKSYYSSSLMSLIKLVSHNNPKDWIIHTLK